MKNKRRSGKGIPLTGSAGCALVTWLGLCVDEPLLIGIFGIAALTLLWVSEEINKKEASHG